MPPQMPTVDALVEGWQLNFYSADHALVWRAAEQELSLDLAPGVVLAGRIDALGDDWFGEWKTMSKWGRNGWREKWCFHPQSLTYGLLLAETHPEISRFTVRVAFKSDPPTFDHEWFSYSPGEITLWREQLIGLAIEIQDAIATEPSRWRINPTNCYKYGPKYPCPHLWNCTHQAFDAPSQGAPNAWVSHLQVERNLLSKPNPPLVLDATRITEYLECPEAYRRMYIRHEVEAESEALRLGKSFHERLDEYYSGLISEACARTPEPRKGE